jgi:hypothetical protein
MIVYVRKLLALLKLTPAILLHQVAVDDTDVDGKELSDVNGMLSGGMEGSLVQLGKSSYLRLAK